MIHSRKQTCPIATYVLVTRNGITPRSPYPPGLRPTQQGLYVGGAGERADRAVWVWPRLFSFVLGGGFPCCSERIRLGALWSAEAYRCGWGVSVYACAMRHFS